MGTRTLTFPADRIVGSLYWRGSWTSETGPVLATDPVAVPDDELLTLTVCPISGVERCGDAWSTKFSCDPLDLDFLNRLPGDSLHALILLPPIVQESLGALLQLAPGLRRLYLSSTMLTDDALSIVSALSGLTYLETAGNSFIDIQQLAALVNLEHLYLREKTLTADTLHFVDLLTN